jgi:hypothetical protein
LLCHFPLRCKRRRGKIKHKVKNVNQTFEFEIVDDIVLLSGSEAYQAALTFYNYIKFLASRGVPRAKTIYEELQKQFPCRPKSKKEENTEEAD